MIKLSIVIINYKTRELTVDCVRSVIKNTKLDFEILLVDNASSDGSVELFRKEFGKKKNVTLIESPKNVGFASGNNVGIKKAQGEYVLLLNSDTVVPAGTLDGMVEWVVDNPKVGVATCSLKNKDGTLQGTGGYFPTLLNVASWMTIEDLPFVSGLIKPFHPMRKMMDKNEEFYTEPRELDWVTGAFMLIRKSVIDEIGLMDEDYFMYTEDTDFCYRAKKAGWKIFFNPKWSITHFGGASSTSEFAILSEYKGIKNFFKKHYPKWQYLPLRAFLKTGALLRAPVFGLLEGKEAFATYAKAFNQA